MDFIIDAFFIIVAIFALLFMVTVHEFGHYIAGKLLGFKINEFAIGFGPKLYSKKRKNGEIFSLRAVPLGGYCAFEGEDEDVQNNPEAFNNHKPWKRIIVLLSGVVMNFLTALLIVILVAVFSGFTFPKVFEVLEDRGTTVADNLKLQKDDILLEVNGRYLYLNGDLSKALSNVSEDEVITAKIIRDGKVIEVEVIKRAYQFTKTDEEGNPVLNDQGNPVIVNGVGLGISQTFADVRLPFFETLWRSVVYAFYLGWVILGTLGALITGAIGLSSVGGPITTIGMTAEIARSGFRNLLAIVSMIGVNFAVFNILPIPALDGSRVVFTVIEWIRGKPVKRSVEGAIHAAGLILLFGFIIFADLYQLL